MTKRKIIVRTLVGGVMLIGDALFALFAYHYMVAKGTERKLNRQMASETVSLMAEKYDLPG